MTKVHICTSKTGDIAYSPMMHSSWREGTLEITMIMLMIARASFLNEIKDLSKVLNVINLSYFFRCYFFETCHGSVIKLLYPT